MRFAVRSLPFVFRASDIGIRFHGRYVPPLTEQCKIARDTYSPGTAAGVRRTGGMQVSKPGLGSRAAGDYTSERVAVNADNQA